MAAQRYLVLKGLSGLGNRLGALCRALLLARAAGRTLVVDWNDWMYSPDRKDVFHRLFDAPSTPRVGMIPQHLAVAPAIWTGSLDKSIDWILDRHGIPYGDATRDRLSIDRHGDPPEPVAVFCDWSFGGDEAPVPEILRQHVRPAARLAERAAAFAARHLGALTIGVHARQSDNMSARTIGTHGVSVAAIEATLADRLRAAPDATVFLATDNRAVLEHLRAHHPRVVSTPKWYPRAAGERMHGNASSPDKLAVAEEALVDLLLLARCDELVYSSAASFGRYAAHLSRGRRFDVASARPDPAEAARWIEQPPWWVELPRRALWHARHRARQILYRVMR
jgi:hypothetical protein